MKKENVILSVSIFLIILAVIIIGYGYSYTSEKTHALLVSSEGYENYTVNVNENNYVVLLTSTSNFSFEVLNSEGNQVEGETNVTNAEVHLNKGTYTVILENHGNKEITIAITQGRADEMNKMLFLTYLSGGFCAIGMIAFLGWIILVMWQRKKEERYSRY